MRVADSCPPDELPSSASDESGRAKSKNRHRRGFRNGVGPQVVGHYISPSDLNDRYARAGRRPTLPDQVAAV